MELVKKNGGVFSPLMVVKCEIAFPHLAQVSELSGKYGVTLVLDKDDSQTASLIKLVNEISQEYCGRPDKENKHPRLALGKSDGAFAGKLLISATRKPEKGAPRVVDVAKRPIQDLSAVGGTSLCNVAVIFAGYEYMKQKGVTCVLQAVQVLEARQLGADPFEDLSGEYFGEYFAEALSGGSASNIEDLL